LLKTAELKSPAEGLPELSLCGLTFELSWHQRWDARARLARMYKVPPTWPAWPAVGAQLERGVRQRCVWSALALRCRLVASAHRETCGCAHKSATDTAERCVKARRCQVDRGLSLGNWLSLLGGVATPVKVKHSLRVVYGVLLRVLVRAHGNCAARQSCA